MITYGSTTLTSYNSIVKTEVYYYKSTSATSLSGGSWATTKPTWENGKYIWQKIRTVYEDGTHSESDPVNITGQQGATGTAAYSFKLNSSDSIIGKTKDGEYTIKKITFSATYKQGTGAVSAYSGRFKIESTTNGSTWKTEYTSSGNEASKEFTIPDDIIAVKCSLYQSGGTTVLLDIVTVPVVKDGVDAIGLRDSIPYYLASDKDTGITRLTQGWTRYRPQLTAEKKYLWVYYVSRYSEGTTEPELIEIKDDLVHFVNNGDESPVESCVVDIEPVQDLNGYDHPWPAGGGVNKFDIDNIKNVSGAYGLTTSIDGDIIRISGTYTGTSGGSAHRIIYHDQPIIEDAKFAIFRLDTNSAIISLRYASTSDNSIVVGISNMTPNTDVDVRFRFMIYTGSTAPTSYSPYSNICPITGWTGAKVTRTGKNLCDPSKINTLSSNYIWFYKEDGFVFKSGVTYAFSVGKDVSSIRIVDYNNNNVILAEADVSKRYVIYSPVSDVVGVIRLWATGLTIEGLNPQLELGSTATDYEPYSGQTYDITFPTEAGTVYGGTLDVTRGELVVDRAMVDLGTLDWVKHASRTNVFQAYRPNTLPAWAFIPNGGIADAVCDIYKLTTSALGGVGDIDMSIALGTGTSVIMYVHDSRFTDVSDFISSVSGSKIVYLIATPVTYTLTPQEITMLCKENNIFADTGQTAISYYDNQTSTDPYVDYSLTSAFDASTIEPAYIETEWVESTGKQYVYLDWKPPIKTWGFEIDFISYNALGTTAGAWNEDTNKNGYGTIFGVRNASGVNNAQLSSYSNGVLRIGNGTNQATGFKTNHTRQQIKLQNTTITKADGTTSTVSRLDETANKPYCNMTIFGLHEGLRRAGNGGISEPSSTRIYSLKFYDGDTLTVDLVGAIRKRDSVTGLYDKVSKHFYPAPGMLFGDVVGDIGDSISMKEAMDKANPQTIVVNKDRTRMWEATVPFNDLQDGQKITVTYSYGNVVSSVETDELIGWDDTSNNQQVYLKLTFADGHKTDWIPCYYSNTSRLTTHYGAGIPIQLTYRENILANASETASGNMVLRGFYADANYDTNNTDIVRWSYGRVIAGSNKIFPYSIIMQNADERWESIVTSSTTAKTKTRNTHGFRLDTILYQAANTTTNENVENTSYQLRTGDPIMDMRYNLNIEDTAELRLVHGKSVYLVGTVGTDGLFYLADQWWSQSLPTTEDGKIYIFLGQVYDWYRCGLATMHPIYKFVDGKLKSTLQIAVDALDKAKEVAQDLADLGADLQAQIDGKIETWCQSTDPSTAWTTTELKNQHNGDLWYYTGESTSSYKNNTTYKYTASTNKWAAYSASTDLFDKIDTKVSIYYGKPSAVTQNLEVGDYLVDSTDGCSYRWDGSKWVKLTDYKAAIDAIEIGGRNYAARCPGGKDWYTLHVVDGVNKVIYLFGNASDNTISIPDIPDIKIGDIIQLSFDIKFSSDWQATGTGTKISGIQGNYNAGGTWAGINYGGGGGAQKTELEAIMASESKEGHINTWFKVIDSMLDGTYSGICMSNIRFDYYSGTVSVRHVMVEKGTKATDWTPAPEDIDASISTAQTTADEALAATQPISSKTFTGVIGTANDIANASLYFAKVHPTTYTDPWMVKMKIKASVPSDTNFRKTVDITIHGCRSNFISYDSIVANYNSNPIYYLNLYRATQAGIETNKKGHALGFGLRSSTSPTDTDKKRTFEVDLLEIDGCTVDWIDTPVKYADMDGTGSTNYVGCTELGVTTNGQNATNNGNTYDRIKYSTIKAAEAIARYNIIVGTSAGYKHLKSGTPWDITYPILYADAALNANATGSSNYLTIPFTVTTTQNMTLTPYKPVYIEGTLDGTTFTPIDTTPLTQTIPTADNGHHYILLGSAYSTTAINLEAEHPIYQFQNGNFVTVAEAASRIGANAENLIKATYAVCSTAAGTNAKTADCTNFELYEGARIQVTFTNANTASAPTLNINNTGAKAIYINKTAASNTNQLLWTAGSKMEFVYDGTGWVAQNVPYALYGTCSTGASTVAKDVTCNEAVICKGTTISVNMTNTNTAANATMNVGSTVAKDIYANGAKLTTNSRFNWRANTTQKFVFDGQVWRMDDDSVKALATAYITEIDDDGIMVHPEDDSTSGWAISDAIQLFKNGISYIKLWIENNIPKIRIGKEDQGHIILDNDSVDIRNDDTVLASFGATSVIGDTNDWHQTIAANQIAFAKGNDIITYISPDKLYTINAEVADAFYISNYSIRNASDGKLVIGLRR